MSLSKARLMQEISSAVSVIAPEVNVNKVDARLNEIIANYDVNRLSDELMEMDLSEKIESYLGAMRIEGLSTETIRDYRIELRSFKKVVNKPVALITADDIRMFLSKEGIMMSTVAKKFYVVRSFFSWLVREEYIIKNPTLKINAPKVPERAPKSLSLVELETLREGCITLRERALFEVMYSTGCRVSEVCGMTFSNLDLSEGMIKVVGKGNKERVVFLSERAKFHLKKYLISRGDECEYLFIAERGEARGLQRCTINQIFKRIAKRSKYSKSLHSHQFRHSFAQIAIDNGMELGDLQQILGHSDPATSMIYFRTSVNRKREAHRKHHI